MVTSCLGCDREILDAGSRFCHHCGEGVVVKNQCPNCGREADSDTNFCTQWGTAFTVDRQKKSVPSSKSNSSNELGSILKLPPSEGITIDILY